MIIKFDKGVVDKCPELYNYVQKNYFQQIIAWCLHSDVRKSVYLKNWINDEVQNPDKIVIDYASTIPNNSDYDKQVQLVLRKIVYDFKYIGDKSTWKMLDYWQTPKESIEKMTGDCEDGAILMYVLCRLKRVPASRLLLLCGDVKGGGHCWLGYRPQEYPLNFAFIDWCYWANVNSMELRNKFYIDLNNKIHEYNTNSSEINSNYYKAWWGFNEETSIKTFKYQFGRHS
jgi:predicted transglutaminase-like cysteine proteinase